VEFARHCKSRSNTIQSSTG